MNRIVLLTGNHLCHNPRVMKEAESLARAGCDVEVLGAWSDPVLKGRDLALCAGLPFRFTAVVDTSAPSLARLTARLRSGLGSAAHRLAGFENPWQLGRSYSPLRRAAFSRKADFYIAHSEAAMVVGCELMREGRRVGIDMEDWYSHDLPPAARRLRPLRLLQKGEAGILRDGVHATCPSRAMAAALGDAYGCAPPAAVYNGFPWRERASIGRQTKDRVRRDLASVHWFSQSLGPGRGVEDLFAALPLLDVPVELHLRGNSSAGTGAWLSRHLSDDLRRRVHVHPVVSNSELLSRIAEHDIGFSGDLPGIRSRDLTVTNKILQYMQAGLAVVASDTAGQREVAGMADGAVFLYPSGDARRLAACLNCLLSDRTKLGGARAAALRAAETVFSWERQEPVLLASVERALRGERCRRGH